MDYNTTKTQPLIPSNGNMKESYLQLLKDYNELVRMNKQLERDRFTPIMR